MFPPLNHILLTTYFMPQPLAISPFHVSLIHLHSKTGRQQKSRLVPFSDINISSEDMVIEQTRHRQKAHAEKRKEDGEASLFLLATLSTQLPVELHVQPKALHWLKINKQTK